MNWTESSSTLSRRNLRLGALPQNQIQSTRFTLPIIGVYIDKSSGQASPGALTKYSRQIALKVVASQIGVTLVAAVAFMAIFGAGSGYSALVGGGIGILPNYYFAVRLFKRSRSTSPENVLRGIYFGECIKIVFTVALFVLAMRVLDVEVWVVALTYLLTVVATWVAVLRADLGESPRGNA